MYVGGDEKGSLREIRGNTLSTNIHRIYIHVTTGCGAEK